MTFWQAKMKRRPNDILWTKYIKLLSKGFCQTNFKCFRGTPGTDVSHWQGRRKETVRYFENNSDFVCRKCHNFIHTADGAKVYDEWKLHQLGEWEYKLLILRANQTGKRDDVLQKIRIKEMIRQL